LNNYKNIIFDLDGTLTDPREGILNSLRYALRHFNLNDIPDTIPAGFVGPPLQQGFKEIYGLNNKETEKAVDIFREYYGKRGLYENYPYNGIEEFLSVLHSEGKSLYLATSKLEKYAWEIIRHFEFDKYIHDLSGAEYKGNHTKSELINDLIQRYRLNLDETIMIGDTIYDIEGARLSGIDCIAVGYGFTPLNILQNYNPAFSAETVDDLFHLLFN
jgi:phosphoglycolate phosphatase